MGKLTEQVRELVEGRQSLSKEFRDQLERNKEFKEKMHKAGVEYGDKYSIPLMARLGHHVRSK